MADYGAPPPPQPPYGGTPYGGSPYGGSPYGGPPQYPGAPGGSYPLASMGQRLGAQLLDILLVYVPLSIVQSVVSGPPVALNDGDLADAIGEASRQAGSNVVFGVIWAGYVVAMTALRGATVGKQIVGLRVVREDTGGLPGWGPAILRWLIQFVGSLCCLVGLLVVWVSPFFDSTGRLQGWHDKVAHTLVVRVR